MEAKRQQKKNREAQPLKSTLDTSDSMDISIPKNDDDLKKIHLENSRRLAELRKVFKLVLDRWRSRPVK